MKHDHMKYEYNLIFITKTEWSYDRVYEFNKRVLSKDFYRKFKENTGMDVTK